MDKKSTHELLLQEALNVLKEKIPSKNLAIVAQFIACYRGALTTSFDAAIPNLILFLQLAESQFHAPHAFEPYHKKVRHPIDYYRFGLEFIRPLVKMENSFVAGDAHLKTIKAALQAGENVVLLANHQTETDPQAIALLLEKSYPEIGENIIYVAGERVITDPLAIPFSLGCDLLCIYSKRYIDHPPELKAKKQLHNKHTMEKMSKLLQEGGKIIYVAPSGGRDRKNGKGDIEVAPFDPGSIEMFYLMARKAKTPTHFIPLALSTYDILPPPESVQKELGEVRTAKKSPIALSFGAPFDMEHFQGSLEEDKQTRRQNRANVLWHLVSTMYEKINLKFKESR